MRATRSHGLYAAPSGVLASGIALTSSGVIVEAMAGSLKRVRIGFAMRGTRAGSAWPGDRDGADARPLARARRSTAYARSHRVAWITMAIRRLARRSRRRGVVRRRVRRGLSVHREREPGGAPGRPSPGERGARARREPQHDRARRAPAGLVTHALHRRAHRARVRVGVDRRRRARDRHQDRRAGTQRRGHRPADGRDALRPARRRCARLLHARDRGRELPDRLRAAAPAATDDAVEPR